MAKIIVTYPLGSRKESDAFANGEENAGLDKVPGDSPSQTMDPMISSLRHHHQLSLPYQAVQHRLIPIPPVVNSQD